MFNAYVFYMVYMAREGVEKKDMLTNYDFQRQIALVCLEPEKYWPTKYQYKKIHHVVDVRISSRRNISESVISNDSSSASSITTMDTGYSTIRNRKMLFNMHQCFCRCIDDATSQPTGTFKIRIDR